MKEDIKILEESLNQKLFFNDRYYKALENLLRVYKYMYNSNESEE